MKILVAEDDFASRILLQKYLSSVGDVHIAVDGKEALVVYREAMSKDEPYDLICLDVMMPHFTGQDVLSKIRQMEQERGILITDGVKIIMTTALSDPSNVMLAFKKGCEAYLVKPIAREALYKEIAKLGFDVKR